MAFDQALRRSLGRLFRLFLLSLCCAFVAACGGDNGTDLDDDDTDPGGDDATQEPVDTLKPTSLPTYSSLSLYSSDSPLNTPIPADPEIDPNSDEYVGLLQEVVTAGGFAIEVKQYSTTVYFADASTPKVNVYMPCGPAWAGVDSLKGVPIPAFAEPTQDTDGADAPIPVGQCGEDSSQDNQMAIVDLTTRCEYDFIRIRKESGKWVADWGNSISMNGNGIYEFGFSGRGAGFTQLAGEIWPDELQAGQINHALIFSYPHSATGGPVPPATESDGVSDHQWGLPEGARVQLDPSLDLSTLGLTAYELTIARALQVYGMWLVDVNSSGISIEAIDPRSVQGNPYAGLLPDEDYPSVANIPVDRFRVLKLPPVNTTADEDNHLVNSGCATFG